MSLKDKPPASIPFTVAAGADPYKFCIMIFHMHGTGNIKGAELLDGTGNVMMYYQPTRGWYFGDHRDHPLPSMP